MNQTYKEIMEQPTPIKELISRLDLIEKDVQNIFTKGEKTFDQVLFIGCGTSFYLAQSAAFFFKKNTNIDTHAVPCSEIIFYPELYIGTKETLIIPITRDSRTTEVKKAIATAKSFKNVTTTAITCDMGSQEYNDHVLYCPKTEEKSIVMTKSYTSMLFMSLILSLFVGGKKDALAKYQDLGTKFAAFLTLVDETSKKIVTEHPELNLFVVLGQGEFYGVSNECSNKLKEMSISNTESYYSLEYRHGPMSLADDKTLIINLVSEKSKEMEFSLVEQLKGYKTTNLVVGDDLKAGFDYTLSLPGGASDEEYAILNATIGQLLGIYLADKKGINPDEPTNLSKAIIL